MDEGEFAQVICIVSKGDEPLHLSWSLHGASISSEPSITTNQLGSRTSMLTIQSVGYRHSGLYTCAASNKAGSASSAVQLKVNGGFIPSFQNMRVQMKQKQSQKGTI